MALSKQDTHILEEIVNLEGKCIDSTRCNKCPFRAMCLPEFLNPQPPSTHQREKMALDILTHHLLVDDDISIEDYKWDKK